MHSMHTGTLSSLMREAEVRYCRCDSLRHWSFPVRNRRERNSDHRLPAAHPYDIPAKIATRVMTQIAE